MEKAKGTPNEDNQLSEWHYVIDWHDGATKLLCFAVYEMHWKHSMESSSFEFQYARGVGGCPFRENAQRWKLLTINYLLLAGGNDIEELLALFFCAAPVTIN